MKWVLIIEPSEFDFKYLEGIISRMGYRAYRAVSAQEARHFLRESLPSAVICGERLPDSDPMELSRTLKEEPLTSQTPLLLATSNRDSLFRSRAIHSGFSEVVLRPMSIRRFFQDLEMCISNNRRKCIRAPMTFPVLVRRGKEKITLSTHNFGEGGLYLETKNPMPRRTPLGLEFRLPSLRTLFNFDGLVVHTSARHTEETPPGMGVEFMNITASMKTILGMYMENHLARAAPVMA